MTEPDFDRLLLEVRHAWRIVAAYQQRVFFLLDELRAGFPELTMTYWEPSFYARPPRGTSLPMEKWSWDGLPYYCTDNWFTLDGKDMRSIQDNGDWFIVVRVWADDGFDTDTAPKSSSFSGPDPLLMPPANESNSELSIYLYHVHSDPTGPLKPWDIWQADYDLDAAPETWEEIPEVSSTRIFWKETLADILAEDGTKKLIGKVRAKLAARSIIAA